MRQKPDQNAEKKFLVPSTGLTIVDPANKEPLPATGKLVAMSGYWHRRLLAGDVAEGTPPAQIVTSTAPKDDAGAAAASKQSTKK